ncbi:MAG: acetyltransferase [Alphaproteobacteria bacterium]|nr:acetyltransferase [Alphaproteobacteria bacterium]
MQKLIIFGTGQIAQVAHYYFSEDSDYEVTAFTVDAEFMNGDTAFGLPVLPFEDIASRSPPDDHDLFVAMGYGGVNRQRQDKAAAARAKGYRLAHYVSSRAWVWQGFEPRQNLFLLEHNTIQPFVEIGENTTLWSGNHIGHHSRIGDNVFIASHVVVSGAVTVGDNCFLGVNATVADNLTVGAHCVIGAGAVLTDNADERGVYPGTSSDRAKIPSNRLRNF